MVLLAISVTVFLSIVSIVASFYIQSQVSKDIAMRNMNLAHALAGQVNSFVQNHFYDLKVLKSRIDNSDPDTWQSIINDGLEYNPFFLMLRILDDDKKVVFTAPNQVHLKGYDQSGILNALVMSNKYGGVLMSDTLASSQTVSATIYAAVPLQKGTLLAEIRFDSLSQLVSLAFPLPDGVVAVVDRLGVIIAHNDPAKAYENLSLYNLPPIKQALSGEKNSWEGEFGDESGLFSASPVESCGWAVVIFQPARLAFGIIQSFQFFYLLITLISALVTLIGFLIFLIYIMAPLKALESQVRKVALGRYDVLLPPFYKELEDLGNSFLQMTDHIKSREAEILINNETLEKRISERTSRLEIANRELETFNFTVSHDLRSPLRAIEGYALALEEDFYSVLNDTGRSYVNRIRSNTERMNQLITDLLTLSRISRQEVHRETVDLGLLIDSIYQEYKAREPGRNFRFSREAEIKAFCDPNLAKIVIENLFSNAWKYTKNKADGYGEFGIKTPGANPILYIRDNGAGFDESHGDKLFQPFQRLHSDSDFPGTGVGLATVQRIMDIHGGWIHGTGMVGQGAEFTFFWGGTLK